MFFFSTYNTEHVIDRLYTRKVECDDEDLLFVAAHVATKQSGGEREKGDYNRSHRTETNLERRGLSTGRASVTQEMLYLKEWAELLLLLLPPPAGDRRRRMNSKHGIACAAIFIKLR